LLTLVGPGGIGKTHLAIQSAAAQRKVFADRVYFVPLVGISSAEFMTPAIAQAVGLNFAGPTDPRAQLINYLRGKKMLLLLDNLEHLLDGVELVTRVLECAPGLRLLVTSRERLDLRGEWVFEVQGLPVPAHDQVEGLESYGAVDLFLQSARRTWMNFELPVQERPYLARICRLVEGMPLGIELAAAWVQVLSCREIAQEIERGLGFFSTSARNVPERHRSMRAVFDHSWALLAEKERQVLRRLSVFRGGFRREAAEIVAGADLPLLAALAAKSLLRCASTGRYDLHELVRQYAAGHLREDPDAESDTRDRHSAYYTDYVGQLEGSLKGARQLEALVEMDAEIDNIRSAWRRAVTRSQVAAIRKPIRALWCFYEIRGWFQEAEDSFGWAAEMLAQAFEAKTETEAAVRVLCEYIRANQGWFYFKYGELEESQKLLSPSLAALRSFAATADVMDVLYFLGVLEWFTGDYARARAHFLEELALATQIGDLWSVTLAHGNLGLVAQTIGEYGEAQERWETTLAGARTLGDQRLIASALHFFGRLKCTLGAYDEARAYLRESLALSTVVGDRWIHGLALGQLGQVAHIAGEYDEAVRMFRDSLALVREVSEVWSTLQALKGLGATMLAMGQYDESHSAFCEAFTVAKEMQAWPEALDALVGLANWSARQGELEAALAQTVLVRNHPATKQETKTQAAQLCRELEVQLTPQQVKAIRARTRAQSFDALATELLSQFTCEPPARSPG
jgi:predicted ATPase